MSSTMKGIKKLSAEYSPNKINFTPIFTVLACALSISKSKYVVMLSSFHFPFLIFENNCVIPTPNLGLWSTIASPVILDKNF